VGGGRRQLDDVGVGVGPRAELGGEGGRVGAVGGGVVEQVLAEAEDPAAEQVQGVVAER
jgi:hypothetical protein